MSAEASAKAEARSAKAEAAPAEPDDTALDPRWADTRRRLRSTVGDSQWRNWLAALALADVRSDRVVLVAATRFKRDWIANHFTGAIAQAWAAANGATLAVEILVGGSAGAAANAPPILLPLNGGKSEPAPPPARPDRREDDLLDIPDFLDRRPKGVRQ
jgi:chromosomal replication initiation ATPase DnaA